MKDNIRKEFVNSIVNTLKIEGNVFNIGLVDDLINHIEVKQYRKFYNDLFGEEKKFMNGLDRVKQISVRYSQELKREEQLNINIFVNKVLSLETMIENKGMPKSLAAIVWDGKDTLSELDIKIICKFGGILHIIEDLKKYYKKTILSITEERGLLKNIKVKTPMIEWK